MNEEFTMLDWIRSKEFAEHEIKRGLDPKRHKSLEEFDQYNWDRNELPHHTILNDEYLLALLEKSRDGVQMRLQEIGDLMGMTRERVRQIESRAMSKLQRRARLNRGRFAGLHEYF